MINRSSGEAAAATGGGGRVSLRQHIGKKKVIIQQRRRPGVCCHFLCRSVQPAAAAHDPPLPPCPPVRSWEGIAAWARWRIFQMFVSSNLSPLVAFKREGKALGK